MNTKRKMRYSKKHTVNHHVTFYFSLNDTAFLGCGISLIVSHKKKTKKQKIKIRLTRDYMLIRHYTILKSLKGSYFLSTFFEIVYTYIYMGVYINIRFLEIRNILPLICFVTKYKIPFFK